MKSQLYQSLTLLLLVLFIPILVFIFFSITGSEIENGYDKISDYILIMSLVVAGITILEVANSFIYFSNSDYNPIRRSSMIQLIISLLIYTFGVSYFIGEEVFSATYNDPLIDLCSSLVLGSLAVLTKTISTISNYDYKSLFREKENS